MKNKTIRQLYKEHVGKVSDKWSLYIKKYDELFFEFRDREIRLLEIGIQNGGSLEIWANYFSRAKKLVGCDADPDCDLLSYDDQRIAIVIGDANTDDTEKAILSHEKLYDLIIDGGLHRPSDIVKSFARYFPHLADGGMFVVEDLLCSNRQKSEGGLFDPFSSITFFKRLADILNHEHWGINRTRKELLAGFANHYDISFDEKVLSHIHSIEFTNSVCTIRKLCSQDNESNLTQGMGKDARVQSNNKTVSDSVKEPLNQSDNIWSVRTLPPEEELIQRLRDLIERDEEISCLKRQQSMLNAELLKLNAERATFEARTGRAMTRLRRRVAPVGTYREISFDLLDKVVTSLLVSGWKKTAAKSTRYASVFIRSKLIRNCSALGFTRASTNENTFFGMNASVQADHLQLQAWIEKNEPTPEQISLQKTEVSAYHYKPMISVIVPVYKVPRDVLDETLASLERQSYSNWQACIVWSDIDDIAGWEWMQRRCVNDSRFKVKLLSENGGISRNSDAALELGDGEYIALLDHDDTLAPWAFYEIIKRLQTSPELDFIYSDKDSISADGIIRMNALFKPEWSPEMLHSVNYLTHLNVIRTSLVREIGGWRSETDGAQDWDLFFRVTERTQNIARIPSILYHWRILPTSTATGLAAKPYAALGQLKSQQDYFIRRGLAATVVPTPEGLYKVCWPVRGKSTDIVIFQNGTLEQLVSAINVLRACNQESIRHIHVIHNTPATDALNAFKGVWKNRIFFSQIEMADWSTALEIALSGDIAETILLLDGKAADLSETMVEELSGWVAQHPDISWASAITLNLEGLNVYEAGRVVSADQHSAPMFSGSTLHSFGWLGGSLWYRNARACSPYAVAMRSCDARGVLSKLNAINGSRDSFVAFCIELSDNGRRGLIDPFARVFFGKAPEENWPNDGIPFHVDPYFNPAFDQVSPLRLRS